MTSLSLSSDTALTLDQARHLNDQNLKSRFEEIIAKYEHDFTGVGDIIDFETGHIVENNGHIDKMMSEQDIGDRKSGINIIANYANGLAQTQIESLSPIANGDEDEAGYEKIPRLEEDQLGNASEVTRAEENEGSEDELASLSVSSLSKRVGVAKEQKQTKMTSIKHLTSNTDVRLSDVQHKFVDVHPIQDSEGSHGSDVPAVSYQACRTPDIAVMEQLGQQISQNIAQFMQIWKGANVSTPDPIWAAPPLPANVPNTPGISRPVHQYNSKTTPAPTARPAQQHAPFSESLWAVPRQRLRKRSADAEHSPSSGSVKRHSGTKSLFNHEEDALILKLRITCHWSWRDIVAKHFPHMRQSQVSARYYHLLSRGETASSSTHWLDSSGLGLRADVARSPDYGRGIVLGQTQPLLDRPKVVEKEVDGIAVPHSSSPVSRRSHNYARHSSCREHSTESVRKTFQPPSEIPNLYDNDNQFSPGSTTELDKSIPIKRSLLNKTIGSSGLLQHDTLVKNSTAVCESEEPDVSNDSGDDFRQSMVQAEVPGSEREDEIESMDNENSHPDVMDSIESIKSTEMSEPVTPAPRSKPSSPTKFSKTPSRLVHMHAPSSSQDPLSNRPKSRFGIMDVEASTSSWRNKMRKRHSLLSESDYYLSTSPTSRTIARRKRKAVTPRLIARVYSPETIGSSEDELAF
ncbi:hypothetical protein EJ05DRAFT_490301 [Pseudovirgaria hyperparasitica]|uniref:Myb-like domain-containing protein n=1 Tax=Pseudovirgaria hyperparasitica TaxID=470096 RepID=A0A6A6VUF7_9PEZI|nr:uncharacterized protein EJ05DRAFT_490301 [Pseudovirgaria hyperparasitica]KAF2753250.1 hypothetical protein EJ05DRAFT_490301 [Pseudovirgaria hyperparasitica]